MAWLGCLCCSCSVCWLVECQIKSMTIVRRETRRVSKLIFSTSCSLSTDEWKRKYPQHLNKMKRRKKNFLCSLSSRRYLSDDIYVRANVKNNRCAAHVALSYTFRTSLNAFWHSHSSTRFMSNTLNCRYHIRSALVEDIRCAIGHSRATVSFLVP